MESVQNQHQAGQSRHSSRHVRRSGNTRRGGSIVVIAAAGIVALLSLCALSVDLGRTAATRNKLQRACDAAALAGAQNLPEDTASARNIAVKVAALNGAPTVQASDITFADGDGNAATTNDANTKIIVRARETISFGFARVFNRNSGLVAAAATAIVQAGNNVTPNTGVPGIVPVGITPSTYNAHPTGELFTIDLIRDDKEALALNDFVLFDLRDSSGKSPAQMQDQIIHGWDQPITIGDTETTLNAEEGAQAKKFEAGMLARFVQAQGIPWNDFGNLYPNIPRDSPRVMTLLMTPENQPVNGTNDAPITGFVPVYVESVSSDGGQMRLRILPPTFLSEGQSQVPGNPTLSGVRSIRLID